MSELHQRMFEEMPCYVSVQDKDLRLIATNNMFSRDFGAKPGAFCYEVYKARGEKCSECPVERTFQDGESHSSEEVVRTQTGEDMHVIVHTAPIRGSNGEVEAVVEISTDITEVKRLQQKYLTLFEEVPCYISVQDRDLRIVEANRRFRTDFGEGAGGYCYHVYKHRTEPCTACPVAMTFQDGRIHHGEEVVTSREGNQVNVLCHSAPIRNSAGEIESVMEMSTNITEVRRLQGQLTSLGLIVGSVSHGIKGLLSGLDGGIYLMDTGFNKNDMDRMKQGWDMVQRNVDRIRSMVLNILYYAKDREVYWQPLDLEETISLVQELVESRAATSGVDLHVSVEPGTFEGDQHSIRSMLVNVMENSIDACRLDKNKMTHHVELAAKPDGDYVVFEITDNGIGMDQETKEKAFSLFFSSKGGEGTGLGLFIAHKIVRSHGGTIDFESIPGAGTRFMVRLPRKRPLGNRGSEEAVQAQND